MAEFNKYATGAAIKKLRCEKKISQEVLSGLAGIARSHLAMIESGKKQANFETIWKISSAFNVHPNELVRLIEEETERIGNSEQRCLSAGAMYLRTGVLYITKAENPLELSALFYLCYPADINNSDIRRASARPGHGL